ncbi:kinase phosphorylation protein-domain-containing protein [Dichotomocladium elegans]|nr:kinase phosphorylation protein-domain-containing protein [Dichotomocladium elegans]
MFHPSRGGKIYLRNCVRGGKDQFSWEDVKEDKYREYYLGHSLMAPVGRWQKGKDLTWYSKESKDDKDRLHRDELARIKEAEAEAMAVALGVKKKRTIESTVTEEELRHAIKRNDDSDDDPLEKVNEEKGLGYGRSNRLIPAGGQTVEVMNEGGSYTSSKPNYGGTSLTGSSSAAYKYEPADKRSSKDKKKKSKKHKKTSSDRKKHHHRHRSRSVESHHHRRRDDSPLHSRHSRHHRRDTETKNRPHRSRSPVDRSMSPQPKQQAHRRLSISIDREARYSAASSRGRNHRSPSASRAVHHLRHERATVVGVVRHLRRERKTDAEVAHLFLDIVHARGLIVDNLHTLKETVTARHPPLQCDALRIASRADLRHLLHRVGSIRYLLRSKLDTKVAHRRHIQKGFY